MELDTQKVDDAVLGLLYLTMHDGHRAWKSMDWDAMDRLFQRGFIHDPATKAKSVVLTTAGLERAEHLCEQLFARPTPATVRVRYGGMLVEAEPADGIEGTLCRSTDGTHFFRVATSPTAFVDYELRHDDLAVTIAPDAMASLYRGGDLQVLDHAPTVLGIAVEGAVADVGV